VVADIVDIARGNASPVFGRPASTLTAAAPAPTHTLKSAFYLRFDVLDEPGVLAEIARQLAEAEVSIESMIQRGRAPGEPVSIVMITHECSHEVVARALKVIAASDRVLGAPCMIPMEAG
jgi:homoserine dehydrogenase